MSEIMPKDLVFSDTSYTPATTSTVFLHEFFFPDAPVPLEPLSERVVVLFPSLPNKTKSGLFLGVDTGKSGEFSQQNAKIVAIGKQCFTHRNGIRVADDSVAPGFASGDIIRVPGGGEKLEVFYKDTKGEDQTATFGLYRWNDISAKVLVDIRTIRTFF